MRRYGDDDDEHFSGDDHATGMRIEGGPRHEAYSRMRAPPAEQPFSQASAHAPSSQPFVALDDYREKLGSVAGRRSWGKASGRGGQVPAGWASGAASSPLAPPSRSVCADYAGLVNEGCTCYLSSLLQLLFHLRYFRNAVYLTPTDDNECCSVARALQFVFSQMEECRGPVHIRRLTAAFEWSESELYLQHDIQEMATLLRDNLEERMKGTVTEGTINRLFEGYGEQVVTTLDKTFCSRIRDTFYDIHLPLYEHTTLMDSLRSLVAKDMLVGDNKYRVECEGGASEYKDAEKSYEFRRFPPVIWFHLKRFEMDLTSPTLETKKVNTFMEFPLVLPLEDLECGGVAGNEEEDAVHNPQRCAESGETCGKSEFGCGTGEQGASASASASAGAARSIQQPFSRNSPAVYDLQGVIVHKGSVRSGHYYCYIREWDVELGRFTRWIEFDDERVTVVPQNVAVEGNFGTLAASSGRPHGALSTNNAYILSYVRRADCAKVFAPLEGSAAPMHVREEIEKEIERERRMEEEANERRRKLILYLLTDEIIFEYVQKCQYATFPVDKEACEEAGLLLNVLKSDTLQHIYDVVAAHESLRRLNLHLGEFRLWISPVGGAVRFAVPLLLEDGGGDLTVLEYLDHKSNGRADTAPFVLYLQQSTRPQPAYARWTSMLLVRKQANESPANCGSCSITFDKVFPIDVITFYIARCAGRAHRWEAYLFLCTEDAHGRYEVMRMNLHDGVNSFSVGSRGLHIRMLRCTVRGPPAWVCVKVEDAAPTLPDEVPYEPQPVDVEHHSLGLPRLDSGNVMIFFKYFNPMTSRIVYVGSAMVPLLAAVRECGLTLLRLLGEEEADVKALRLHEEVAAGVRLLNSDNTLFMCGITMGSVLVAQACAPHVFSHPFVDAYLSSLHGRRVVRVCNIALGERVNAEGVSVDASGLCDCASDACNEDTDAFASLTEVLASTTNVGCDGDVALCYPAWAFRIIQSHTQVMDIRWRYEEVCEAIGRRIGQDPEFIRLYRCKAGWRGHSVGSEGAANAVMPAPEVDPSPTGLCLFQLLYEDKTDVTFFEVSSKPRRVLGAQKCVVVKVCAEDNSTIYKEKILMHPKVTVGDMVRATLHRCAETLRTTPPCVGGAPLQPQHEAACTGPGTSGDDNENSESRARGTCPTLAPRLHTVVSHYLALLTDPYGCVIKQIIEVPLVQDGADGCTQSPSGALQCAPGATHEHPVGQLCEASEQLHVTLVPTQVLRDNQFRLPCCHGELLAPKEGAFPVLFERPLVLTVSSDLTVGQAQHLLLERTGVSVDELVQRDQGIVLHPTKGACHAQWSDRLLPRLQQVKGHGHCQPSLLLNHSRPKERPGSRYVAQDGPALRISRKLQHSVPGTAST
ncbi:Ubiquitin carboxyl terminal hydrolase ICP0 binding domain [Trypanosoma vivax]|nr:Ubiquitin carboxyl terminal hydrolase ICP0 binding domain [Trypanosoma vivax]